MCYCGPTMAIATRLGLGAWLGTTVAIVGCRGTDDGTMLSPYLAIGDALAHDGVEPLAELRWPGRPVLARGSPASRPSPPVPRASRTRTSPPLEPPSVA